MTDSKLVSFKKLLEFDIPPLFTSSTFFVDEVFD
jgi:hypothetical protein